MKWNKNYRHFDPRYTLIEMTNKDKMSHASSSYKGNKKKNQEQDVLSAIFIGIFKALWWLIRLPFRGIKLGVSQAGLSLDERNYIVTKRHQLESMLDSHNEIELKHAVMEADKLVDYALKAQGYRGETFADRLRSAEKNMGQDVYNQLWQGHKIRNQIAHESGFTMKSLDLREASEKLLNYLKTI